MFVTIFCAILDRRSGEVICGNGGHNPPVVLRPGRGVEALAAGGTLLGVLDGARFPEHRLSLRAGDTLLLFTDGVTEAADAGDRLYGEARLAEVLAQAATGSAEQLVEVLLRDVARHSGGVAQSDDITVPAARYLGPP